MRTEQASTLRRIYEALWRALGATDEEAVILARCFLEADLMGKETQGMAALALVHPRVRAGALRFGAPTVVVREGPGFALLDGQYGPGQVVSTRAMEHAITKAKQATVGTVWVRNTNVFTAGASCAGQALAHDCFGLAMCNGVPLVAPWGGRDPVFNTSPMAFAVLAGRERPILFDGATSAVSHGAAVLAARDGRRLPADSLVDAAGRRTDDPGPLIVDPFDRNSAQLGAILPLGAKGFGWLLLVEVLAGLLSGMKTAREIPFDQTADDPWAGGLFFMAIDIGALVNLDDFKAKVDGLIRACKGSRLAAGFDEIVMPGERAQAEAERRAREGIPLRDEDWATLVRIAAEAGLDLDALREGP